MSNDIGNPHIARSGALNPAGAAYIGAPAALAGNLAVVPPQAQPGMRTEGSTRRRTGLMPAVARAKFPVIIRDNPGKRVDPRKLAELRATVRRLEIAEKLAAIPWVESTQRGTVPAGDEKLRVAYQQAVDILGAARRELSAAEESARGKPTQVRLTEAREPSAVAHAFDPGYDAPRFRCLHDRCQGDEWASEGDMRRAHPSASEMDRDGQAHVFALYSDAPMDPADPEGEKVGLIAAIGTDGATVGTVSAQASAEPTATAADVDELRAELKALRAQLGNGKGGKA